MMVHDTAATIGRHAVILAHPGPNSFNHAIAEAYCDAVRSAGHEVVLRDLYALGFDPVLRADEQPTGDAVQRSADVARELAAIGGSDVFVLVYPIWFGTPPAMLKGYVERVLGADVQPNAVRSRSRSALLGDKRLLSFSTSATSRAWLSEQGQEQSLRNVFDQYLVHAFGMRSQEHRRFADIGADLSKAIIARHLAAVAVQAGRTCAQVTFGDEALMRDPSLARFPAQPSLG